MANLLQNIPALFSALLFGGILVFTFQTGRAPLRYRPGFRALAATGLAWAGLQAAALFDFLPESLLPIAEAGLLAVYALGFRDLTQKFLKKHGLENRSWMAALAWIAFLVLVSAISDRSLTDQSGRSAKDVSLLLVYATSAAAFLLAFRRLIGEYRRMRQPLHRNRITYWLAAGLAGALAWVSQVGGFPGIALLLAASAALVCLEIIRRKALPDIRGGSLRLMTALITTSMLLVVYTLGYMFALYFLQVIWGQNALVAGLGMGAGLALVFRPVFHRLESGLKSWLGEEPPDQPSEVQRFTLATANILDMEQLAEIALAFVAETLDTRSGALITVSREKGRKGHFVLQPVRIGRGAQALEPGKIPARSPLGKYFSRQLRPITQFIIDQLEDTPEGGDPGHEWLASLNLDVHAPIHVGERWVALLSLGHKQTGLAYSEAELNLLQLFAQQLSRVIKNILAIRDVQEEGQNKEIVISNLSRSHQELKRIERAKSDFIQLASHELRNPLSVVYGYAQMLGEAPALREDEQFRTLIGGLHNSSEQLGQIADNLLEVANIDNFTIALDPLPLPLTAILASLKHRFEIICRQRNLELDIEDMKSLPPVDIDRESMQKVFYNLLNNAVRYTPPGGKIRISGSFLSARGTAAGEDCVRVTLEDSRPGAGNEPGNRQVDSFPVPNLAGPATSTGLRSKEIESDLAIALAQKVVESHGGRIWIENPRRKKREDPGSRIHLLLPVRQTRNSPAP